MAFSQSAQPCLKHESVKQLIQLIDQLEIFKFAVLSFFEAYVIDNAERVKKELA